MEHLVHTPEGELKEHTLLKEDWVFNIPSYYYSIGTTTNNYPLQPLIKQGIDVGFSNWR